MGKRNRESPGRNTEDEYLSSRKLISVLCLKTKPSRIGLNSSLYDDFPYLHVTAATKVLEHAEAGLLSSPVMADKNGFGGNGDDKKTETTPSGTKLKCVTSGPFAKLRPEYLEDEPKNLIDGGHCMFRNMPEVNEPEAYKTMAAILVPMVLNNLKRLATGPILPGRLKEVLMATFTPPLVER
ncbi:hypothetical protein FGRMN_3030 [Fusarium graminum]|nr:hypothetical protein FGRMN_3030 [Fusarium graminum]